jgi:hypothetical protein
LENENTESLSKFSGMKFRCVVFKPSDALEIFAPEGCDEGEFLDEVSEEYDECRWYPEDNGGHRVFFHIPVRVTIILALNLLRVLGIMIIVMHVE